MADISKLKRLYEDLDRLKGSGEDVVAEIRAEINNLEIEILKEEIIPNAMKRLANELSQLRCTVDFSFQFDGSESIEYSFCKSGSISLIRNSVTAGKTIAPAPVIESKALIDTPKENRFQTVQEKPEPPLFNFEPTLEETARAIPGLNVLSFKNFLSSLTSNSGKGYSASSINVYGGTVSSAYVKKKISKYRPDGDIYKITDISTLSQLYADIAHDAELKLINRVYMVVMKLYIQFFAALVKCETPAVIGTEEKPKSELSRKAVLPKISGPIKKIITDEFSIEEGNPTEMIVEFIKEIGADLVYEMKIPYLGRYLVDTSKNPKYPTQMKPLPGGYWVNTCSSTPKKIQQMHEIAQEIGLNIEIIT